MQLRWHGDIDVTMNSVWTWLLKHAFFILYSFILSLLISLDKNFKIMFSLNVWLINLSLLYMFPISMFSPVRKKITQIIHKSTNIKSLRLSNFSKEYQWETRYISEHCWRFQGSTEASKKPYIFCKVCVFECCEKGCAHRQVGYKTTRMYLIIRF